MRLILIRHGRTEWNVAGRVQGRTDIPLDDLGHAQAEAIARRLSDVEIDAIYASPLSRAYDTARAIATHHICGIHVAEELTEINFGAWEGKTGRELEAQYADLWQDWNWILHPETCRKMGAESADDILQRALRCMNAVLAAHPAHATVVLVSHTMPIKLLTAHLIGLPAGRIRALKLTNCSYTELEVMDAGHAQLWAWNDTSHLRGEFLQKGEAL